MSLWSILEHIEFLEAEELEKVEHWLDGLRRKHPHRRLPDAVRFGGFFHIQPNGDIAMATQHIDLNTPFTAPLLFSLAGASVSGPATGGSLTIDQAFGTASLSADGQSANITLTATTTAAAPATLTYSGPGANGTTITASIDLTDDVVAPPIVLPDAVAFGEFTAGTTS